MKLQSELDVFETLLAVVRASSGMSREDAIEQLARVGVEAPEETASEALPTPPQRPQLNDNKES